MPRTRPISQRKLLGAAILSDHAWSEIANALGVTTREVQIIQGVFDNLTQKGIANRLSMTEHTAHTHLNRLFVKLTVTTRTELVLRVMEQMIALTLAETGVLPPSVPVITAVLVACTTRLPAPKRRKRNLRHPSPLRGKCRPNSRLDRIPPFIKDCNVHRSTRARHKPRVGKLAHIKFQ